MLFKSHPLSSVLSSPTQSNLGVNSMMLSLLNIAFLLLFIPLIDAQTFHNVTAGVVGSFFDPETISVGLNDTVNFIFAGSIHSITQSTFDNPCTPLRGGFSSPLLGRMNILEDPAQMFSIVVTNVSEPIWFFCSATRPSSHCNGGMVGAINPPSQSLFQQFKNSARLATGTPSFMPSLMTQGIGVIAAAPITISAATPSSLLSTPIPTTPIETTIDVGPVSTESSSSSSSSSNASVIGGAIGGAIGALILIILSLVLCYRFKAHQNRRSESGVFTYTGNQQQPGPGHTRDLSSVHGQGITSGTATITSKASTPNYQITSFSDSSNIQQLDPRGVTQSVQMIHHQQPSGMTRTVLSDPTSHSVPSTTPGQLSPKLNSLQPQRYIGGSIGSGSGDSSGTQTQTHPQHTHPVQSPTFVSHAQSHINNPRRGSGSGFGPGSGSGIVSLSGLFPSSTSHSHSNPYPNTQSSSSNILTANSSNILATPNTNTIASTSPSPGIAPVIQEGTNMDVDIKALAKEVAAILRPLPNAPTHQHPHPHHDQGNYNKDDYDSHEGVKVDEMNITTSFNDTGRFGGGLYSSSSPAPPPMYPSTGNNSFA